jgi:hypothetical protein
MAKRAEGRGRYPRDVMREPDIYWSFTGPTFRSRSRFEEAVRRYHRELGHEDNWRPEELVLPCPRVRVRPDFWDDLDPEEAEGLIVELSADDGAGFTAGELLFKVHNAFMRRFAEAAGDYTFFEGFHLAKAPTGDNPPLYDICLGS